MQLARIRSYSKVLRRFRGLLHENPVLYSGLALPFAISATFSLQNGVALSILMAMVTLPALLAASLVRRHIPRPYRIILYSFIAMGMLFPARWVIAPIAPNIFDSLGIYFTIMAVNTLMFARAENYAIHHPPHLALFDGLCHVLGFSIVTCLLSLVRELFGAGTLWGIPVEWVSFKIQGLLVPFSGFILLGFLAAAAKTANRSIKYLLVHAGDRFRLAEAEELEEIEEMQQEMEEILEEREELRENMKRRRRGRR